MATEQRLNTIVINKVENKAVYDNMLARGLVNDDEFYLVDDSEEVKVKSVNGNTPNADGNVTLSASDVGALASDGKAVSAGVADSANAVTWSNVTGKPTEFTPTSHTHDDRYYTESEMDTKLGGKSDVGHTHDDRYYTETETNALLNDKANSSDVYTKTETDNRYLKLSGGELSGALKFANDNCYINSSASGTNLNLGWDYRAKAGAMLGLRGATNESQAGRFYLMAQDGTNDSTLAGFPNGTLTWNGNDIALKKDFFPISGGNIEGVVNVLNNNVRVKYEVLERGNQTTTQYLFPYEIVDKNNNRLGAIYETFRNNGAHELAFLVYKGLDATNTYNRIGVGYDENGNFRSYIPTPAVSDNTTQIATTSFTKSQTAYQDFVTGSVTVTAGTIGTRGVQHNFGDISLSRYTIVGISVVAFTSSSNDFVIPFTHNNILYCNFYRCVSTEHTNSASIRVFYRAN